MQFLWIGCLESDDEFRIKAKKGYTLASAQVSQKNLFSGLEEVTGKTFDSINGAVLPPFPIYDDKIVVPVEWEHKENAYDISVGYKNYRYINRISCKKAMLAAAKNWIENRYSGGGVTIIVYSMRSGPMATACYIKKRIKNASIHLIVTDLPQFMDLGQSKFKAALKKIDWVSIKRMQNKIDGFILYAAKMAEFLKIPNGKWILMEGSYDAKELSVQNNEKKKALIYSGKLDDQYGIRMLLDAFLSIEDPEIELWLTGGGNAENYIKECASLDNRIKFFGFLPTREDVLKLQQQASLLVNMRLPSEPASSYCFPSKLFEYMASGVPVISFDLEGIPEEYSDKLILIENESTESLAEAICRGLSLSQEESIQLGCKAKNFIVNKKNTQVQCERINSFINQWWKNESCRV